MSNDPKIPNEDELWDVLNAPTADKTASPEKKAPARENSPKKSGRKIDGFFLGSMAGVAALSVAATLAVSAMVGGGSVPSDSSGTPGSTGSANSAELEALRQENAQLKAQVELQKSTIVDLQNNLMEFLGTEEFLEQAATAPSGENDVLDKQTQAYELLVQIQNAYSSFDREKLEELIPQMDALVQYLSNDALNNYYMILEFMEQPSNG